ncbi:MAG: prolyl oligopeptidase family serine peptidase [Clostridia bacterium]|nr:prolyl oligopeptidase family serine peptidase [Clostridia bacterium]
MEKIISYENLRSFAYVNDRICTKPVKGIIISFFGLGNMSMFENETLEGEYYGEKGILYVVPYNNPWAWMNRQAAAYTDEIIDVLAEEYGLNKNIPIVSTGGSMGGQSALVYMVYAKRTPAACVVNCPVCDMPYHFTERPDLPRTIYSAVFNENSSFKEAVEAISPIHLTDRMPKVPYYIFHCDEDQAVNKQSHSDRLVAKMRDEGFCVTYDTVPGRGHCDLDYNMKKRFARYAVEAILREFETEEV